MKTHRIIEAALRGVDRLLLPMREQRQARSDQLVHVCGMGDAMKTHRVIRNYEWLAHSFWFGDCKGDAAMSMHSGFHLVRVRKAHPCSNWREDGEPDKHFIMPGAKCIVESCKYDGQFRRAYTCLPCLDAWAKEIGE